jgi:hypothetical protein
MTVTNQLPGPLYAGTGVTITVEFAPPVPGEPPENWPLVDPTTITLSFIPGLGEAEVTWIYGSYGSITRVGVGSYLAELPTSANGTYRWKWIGTGTCAVVVAGGFQVTNPPF